MRRQLTKWSQPIIFWTLMATLFVVVAIAVTSWMRWPALALLVALALLGNRRRAELRRVSARACDAALTANAERLREMSALQGALANELNNPLAAVKALSGLMELEPAQAQTRLPVLQAQVRRMQHIIEELLDFSRPLTPMVHAETDVRRLMRRVAEVHQPLAARKCIAVTVDDAGEPLWLRCDPNKLEQALMSLVHNAVDASTNGGSVVLKATADDTHVRVAVLDRGPGIAAAALPNVVRAGFTTKANAAGLGLTVADALVRQHGGTLTLANRSCGGLAAAIALPIECAVPALCRAA
ncbi:MAG TPA: HAMP domain-containing sensor histidine kinase [Polyangia bacterium]|jgi:signal transduction histidine kinase|nr:HAMP domain-containing sensor histidine kinase [Polyangia bacterium]